MLEARQALVQREMAVGRALPGDLVAGSRWGRGARRKGGAGGAAAGGSGAAGGAAGAASGPPFACVSKPAVKWPSQCVSDACISCTTDNCDDPTSEGTHGCWFITDPGDRALCEAAYACFTDPANNCTNQGDPLKCWCGTNPTTCLTDNSPPTQANGPCLQQVFAAAKSTDAATVKLEGQ